MYLLLETAVAFALSVLLFILVKKRKTELKNLENVVHEKFKRNGWTVQSSTVQNGIKLVLFKRGRNSVLVVFVKDFSFEVFKRVVVFALLNQAQRVEVYYSTMTFHTQKAVHAFNKNRKLHRTKIIVAWRGVP